MSLPLRDRTTQYLRGKQLLTPDVGEVQMNDSWPAQAGNSFFSQTSECFIYWFIFEAGFHVSQADLEVAMSQRWGSQASTITPFYAVLGSKPELQTC